MRIKYIYQLFLSHISILIIAFMILSLVVAQYAESFVYENKVEELEQYGNRILTDVKNNRGERALREYEHVLSARGIRFSLFDDKGMIFYPYAGNAPRFQPTEEEWQNLKAGERIVVKHEIKRFDQEVSLVALPYLENGNLSGGILLVSPIKGSRETISEINRYLLYTILISLSISLLLSWFLSNVHVKRIQRIGCAEKRGIRKQLLKLKTQESEWIPKRLNQFGSVFTKQICPEPAINLANSAWDYRLSNSLFTFTWEKLRLTAKRIKAPNSF